MTSPTVPMPNDAARRADALTQTVLTLAKEVWTLRDRQLVLEAVLQERGIDVGESELAAEYAAAGVQVGINPVQTPAGSYVAAAGAVPPAAPANE